MFRAGAVATVVTAAADATVSRDGGSSSGRSRALRRAAALVAVLALVMLSGALGVGAVGIFLAGGGAHGVVASPSTAATPTPTPTAAPTPTLILTPTPSSSAAPAPTKSPTPTPIVHVVASGETLTSIAAHYGVTVKAIQDANKIVDPSRIMVDDRLVIPPPP